MTEKKTTESIVTVSQKNTGQKGESKNIRPSHYNGNSKYECIDVIRELYKESKNDGYVDYNRFQAFKYLYRLGKKDDVLYELKKARTFLDFAIEALEEERKK